MQEAKKRQEDLRDQVSEVKFAASLAERRSNELDQYIRRNNCRVYGIPENGENGDREGDCEEVLKVFQKKM